MKNRIQEFNDLPLIFRVLSILGVVLLTMVVLSLFARTQAQEIKTDIAPKYEVTNMKWWGFGITAAAGFIDGVVEGYEFDGRKAFERKWGVEPYSFFGSMSWDMPMNGWERNFGQVDFYHVADDARKIGYIGGGVVIGIGGAKQKQKFKHYLLDFAISVAVSSVAKRAGMYYVREIDNW